MQKSLIKEAIGTKKPNASFCFCGKKSYSRFQPLCYYHYCVKKGYYAKGYVKSNARPCRVIDCNKNVYAKEYCRNHYALFLRNGEKLSAYYSCCIPKCDKRIRKGKYCQFHLGRILKGQPLEGKLDICGSRNPRWNGGTSEYKNHYLMKKNRLIKIKIQKGVCGLCNKKGRIIHHKDGSKYNHSLDNLIFLCYACHFKIHSGRRNKTSKLKRIYGLSIPEISDKFGYNFNTIYRWHKEGVLLEMVPGLKEFQC
jgi:hypothetical protein